MHNCVWSIFDCLHEFLPDVLNSFYVRKDSNIKILQRILRPIGAFAIQKSWTFWNESPSEYYTERVKNSPINVCHKQSCCDAKFPERRTQFGINKAKISMLNFQSTKLTSHVNKCACFFKLEKHSCRHLMFAERRKPIYFQKL